MSGRAGWLLDDALDVAVPIAMLQLDALADRHGTDLLDDVTRRLTELHQGKHVDLHWLRAAIDNVIAEQEASR